MISVHFPLDIAIDDFFILKQSLIKNNDQIDFCYWDNAIPLISLNKWIRFKMQQRIENCHSN